MSYISFSYSLRGRSSKIVTEDRTLKQGEWLEAGDNLI